MTSSNGIYVNNALSGIAITINGISVGGSTSGGGAVMLWANLTATTGNINITGTVTAGMAVSNYNGASWIVNAITANSGAVNITAAATTTGYGTFLGPNNSISSKAITITGTTNTGSYGAYLYAMTIVSGGTNINITGTGGSSYGIYDAANFTDNAAGSNISFISNKAIYQSGTITLVPNTTTNAASITYNTTSGDKTATITTGTLTIGSGSNTSAINYIVKSAGSAINPGAIGSATVALPGYVLLDNTYGCSGSGCTPVTGFINTTTNNLATLAPTSVGVTINNAIYATGNITANGVSNGSQGMNVSAVITSTGGTATLTGGTTNTHGFYTPSSLITANNINVTGTSSAAPAGWDVYLGPLTINSGATGGSITVTGNVIGIPGGGNGIYQAGAITGANGSNISFISNNNINQNGTITLAANTSGTAANITYDITTGNKSSTLNTGAFSVTSGSTAVINYSALAAGAALTINSAVTVPGSTRCKPSTRISFTTKESAAWAFKQKPTPRVRKK